MPNVAARLRFIEPQPASPVDQPPKGNYWIHELKHDGYRCQVLLEQGSARVLAMDTIGASAIPRSWTRLPTSGARQRSSMARPSSKMAVARLISTPFNQLSGGGPTKSSSTPSICFTSTALISDEKRYLSVEPNCDG